MAPFPQPSSEGSGIRPSLVACRVSTAASNPYGKAGFKPDGSYVSIVISQRPDTEQPANKSKEKEEGAQ